MQFTVTVIPLKSSVTTVNDHFVRALSYFIIYIFGDSQLDNLVWGINEQFLGDYCFINGLLKLFNFFFSFSLLFCLNSGGRGIMEKKSNIIFHLIMLKICHPLTLLSLKIRWGLWFVCYISLTTYWKSGLYTHNCMCCVWEGWMHSSLFSAAECFCQDIPCWKLFKEIEYLGLEGIPM